VSPAFRRAAAPRPAPAGSALLLGLVAGSLLAHGAAMASPASPSSFHKGIALGLFAEDPGFSYEGLLREIARTGADHVSVVVPYYQHDVRATRIEAHPRFSPPDEVLERTLEQARRLGLSVLLFPILRLEVAATPDEWRGSIHPTDPAAWWRSYEAFILKMARAAAAGGASALCVGSELGTLDGDDAATLARWEALVGKVRRVFRGALVYSANWDRYEKVAVFRHVDLAGISAYFQLTDGTRRATLHDLVHAWREQRVRIQRWIARVGKPLLVTELGYHSQRGTSAWPWDEAADRPIDLAEQADCYRAFVRVFRGAAFLRGVYFWNWFGWGGPDSREYCPRGKPSALVICEWYGAAVCPLGWGVPGGS
jgi:hypothetical protein